MKHSIYCDLLNNHSPDAECDCGAEHMTPESKTPRTDANANNNAIRYGLPDMVDGAIARTLERELADSQSALNIWIDKHAEAVKQLAEANRKLEVAKEALEKLTHQMTRCLGSLEAKDNAHANGYSLALCDEFYNAKQALATIGSTREVRI